MGTDAVRLVQLRPDSSVCREENKTETSVLKSVEQAPETTGTTPVMTVTMSMGTAVLTIALLSKGGLVEGELQLRTMSVQLFVGMDS